MALCPSLEAVLNEARKNDEFWVEDAKFKFSLELAKNLNEQKINKTELAKRIGTSKPYISKVFRGEANLTIESMTKIARALNCNLSVTLENNTSQMKLSDSFFPHYFLVGNQEGKKFPFSSKDNVAYLADAA